MSSAQLKRSDSCHHSRCDLHCHELLEEKLAGVRDKDLRDARLVAATATLKDALVQISDGNHSADVAHMDAEAIGALEQALLHDRGDAVRNHAIMHNHGHGRLHNDALFIGNCATSKDEAMGDRNAPRSRRLLECMDIRSPHHRSALGAVFGTIRVRD
eukprot:scaffold115591_cov32-Tisochrysis_lutea.AAC.5